MIEAGMGYGKSRLLRQAALDFSDHKKFQDHKTLPIFINFHDLINVHNNSLNNLICFLTDNEKIDLKSYSLLFFIDSVDEDKSDNSFKVEKIAEFINQIIPHEKMRVVFASRPFDDPVIEQDLEKSLKRYSLQPLSMKQLVSFIEKICKESIVTTKLKHDLQKSDLFKSLPRTPISAILLGRILKTDIKELPSTLSELYSKYMDLALGRWNIQKGQISEKEYETTVILVRIIAKTIFEQGVPEIALGDVKMIVNEYLTKRNTGQEVESLLANIISCSEIISIDERKNKLFFRHRTFLEFMYSEELFFQYGAGFKIENPFSWYWGAVNYFYLGKLKDCPSQLESIFNLLPQNEQEILNKLIQAGSYLLAAYHSPYKHITECVKKSILDAADLFCKVCEQPINSSLGKFSEIHLLAIMTGLMRYSFEYEFFDGALRDVETDM